MTVAHSNTVGLMSVSSAEEMGDPSHHLVAYSWFNFSDFGAIISKTSFVLLQKKPNHLRFQLLSKSDWLTG